jgi:F-type H+-transporting ATPase subunit delta
MNKAKEYGYALYDLAAEEGLEQEIEKEFAEIALVFESNHDFMRLLSNPRISTSERILVLDNVFGNRIQPYLLYLLKLFTESRDVSLIPLAYKEFKNKYYDEKNILLVTAISAVELNENQRQRIINKLEKLMNKTIVLENEVDKTCIGGIRLEYRGHMIDASIKNRFKKLQHDLKNADYSQAEV